MAREDGIWLQDWTTGDNLKVNADGSINVRTKNQSNLGDGVSFYVTSEYYKASAGSTYFSFKTPSGKITQLSYKCAANRTSYFNIFENPTSVTYSSSLTPKNKNRDLATASGSTLQVINTYSTLGTFLFKEVVYDPAQSSQSPLFQLKANTEYVIQIQATINDTLLYVQLNWSEI